MSGFLARKSSALFALTLAGLVAFAPGLAEARMGGGGSFGSRGSRTYSAPPVTRTMPGQASPFERTITPRPSPGMAGQPGYNPGYGGFGRGLLGGLAGGLLGAGLFGLLTGSGFFGGMGGFMSIIGLLMQIALLFFLARLAMAWWANRNAPAGANGRAPFVSPFTGGAPFGANGPGGFGAGGFGGGFGSRGGAQNVRATPIQIAPDDFNAFERLLGETQAAYSREDIGALRMMTTPEMASYFDDQLDDNRRRGVVNRVSNVKLEQGDLAEAWREGADDYATVAMRFSLNDVYEDRASGRVTPDSPGQSQAVEAWTFRRDSGSGPQGWKLSAIQQSA